MALKSESRQEEGIEALIRNLQKGAEEALNPKIHDELKRRDEIKQDHLQKKASLESGSSIEPDLPVTELITKVLTSYGDQDISALEDAILNPSDGSTQLKSALDLIHLGRSMEKLNEALLRKCKNTPETDRHWRSSQLQGLRAELCKKGSASSSGYPASLPPEASPEVVKPVEGTVAADGGGQQPTALTNDTLEKSEEMLRSHSAAYTNQEISWDQILDAVELAREMKEHFKMLERAKRKELKDVKKAIKKNQKMIEKVEAHLSQAEINQSTSNTLELSVPV